MNHLHWMKLYIGDELSNTAHMTPAEFGSYILLKMHYWRFGCLPNDDDRLARIARVTTDEWQHIKPSIGPLFEDDWRDPKLETQRDEAEERHKKLSEAGKKGGRPRKDEKPGNKPGFLPEKASPKQPEPEPEPEPDLYSDPKSKSDPDSRAWDGGRKGTNTREDMFEPFPIPATVTECRKILIGKGVSDSHLDECIRLMMGGNFGPFELEGILESERSAA